MSASIAAGVRELPESSKAVIITPVDHAAVPPDVVEKLIHEWQNGAQVVKPVFNERGGHPVLIDLAFRKDLLSLNAARGLKGFFEVHADEVARVAVNSNLIARDMDTWDDYCALHLEVFGALPPQPPRGEHA
jgi:CTP:molybdopterin cytidylyltransferase MocA